MNVSLDVGRNLTVESRQDTAQRRSESSDVSGGVSYSYRTQTFGGNAAVGGSSGKADSAVVEQQSAILARGGELKAVVGGNTHLGGGVIAAVDQESKDTGRLTLDTGTLTTSDIKDSAKSRDVSANVSVSINEQKDSIGGSKATANLPVVDDAYSSSDFEQTTRSTLGQGAVTVRDPANSSDLGTVNRDVTQAQVVTKDEATNYRGGCGVPPPPDACRGVATSWRLIVSPSARGFAASTA